MRSLVQLPLLLLDLVSSWLERESTYPPQDSQAEIGFQLRHLHASTSSGNVVFQDVSAPTSGFVNALKARTRTVNTIRPPSFDAYQSARQSLRDRVRIAEVDWVEDEVQGPDVESRETLHTLAKMTSNAYYKPGEKGWYDLGAGWNSSYPVGWQPSDDGFRGHVFATPDNSTVVLSIKGTSIPLVGGGPTMKKDKLNDNLLFSCCCARVDWTWSTVCGCYRGQQRCDQTCVENALIDDSLFYPIGTNLYNNLTYMYPDANIWLIGHSLGGSLASLLGSTFGAPVVAFEAPGERMAARRLHLPTPPSLNHITHVYNTGDPIAMGVCTGSTSTCGAAGYALESRCHLGQTLLYDTVANLSWSVGITHHSINAVVDTILAEPWLPAVEMGREVPVPISEDDCVDCFTWEYGDFPEGGLTSGACALESGATGMPWTL